jgi:phage tail-like protein
VSEPAYPYLNHQFRLTVDNETLGACSECTGLSLEVTTEDYHEGGENRFVHKLPTAGSVPNLVLKRGVTASNVLWDWFAAYVKRGRAEPRDGQVELLAGAEAETVRTWKFTHGYPVKWTGPELNAMTPGVAFEAVEIVHHGIELVTD